MKGFNWGDIPGNFNGGTYHSGSYTTDAANIKSAGFNFVEVVKEWPRLENSANTGVFTYDDAGGVADLGNRVSALEGQGIYVSVKLHADNDNNPSDANQMYNIMGNGLIAGSGQYCVSNGSQSYSSDFSPAFYTTTGSSGTSGAAHLLKLILHLDSQSWAGGNANFIGFDAMNEPWWNTTAANGLPCYTGGTSVSTIRSAWHTRNNEILKALDQTNNDPSRLLFVEEAPNFNYYGDPCCGVQFNGGDIPYSNNWVAEPHNYKEANTGNPGSSCYQDYYTIWFAYSNQTTTGGSPSNCTSTAAQWAYVSQIANPTRPFVIGEFGDMWSDSVGGTDSKYNVNATRVYAGCCAGWSYWASSSVASAWTTDILTTFPFSVTSTATLGSSHQFTFSNPSITGGLGYFAQKTQYPVANYWCNGQSGNGPGPVVNSTMIYIPYARLGATQVSYNDVYRVVDNTTCAKNKFGFSSFSETAKFTGISSSSNQYDEISTFAADNTNSFNGHEYGFRDRGTDNHILGYYQYPGPIGVNCDTGLTGDGVQHNFTASVSIASGVNTFSYLIDGIQKCTLTDSTHGDYTVNQYTLWATTHNNEGTTFDPGAGKGIVITSWTTKPITKCQWAFGDGSTAQGCFAQSHTYAAYGANTVTLTVTDDTRTCSATNCNWMSFNTTSRLILASDPSPPPPPPPPFQSTPTGANVQLKRSVIVDVSTGALTVQNDQTMGMFKLTPGNNTIFFDVRTFEGSQGYYTYAAQSYGNGSLTLIFKGRAPVVVKSSSVASVSYDNVNQWEKIVFTTNQISILSVIYVGVGPNVANAVTTGSGLLIALVLIIAMAFVLILIVRVKAAAEMEKTDDKAFARFITYLAALLGIALVFLVILALLAAFTPYFNGLGL